jgi:hypothetical protein
VQGVLPSLDGWQHYGAAQVNNKPADLWQLKEMSGEKVGARGQGGLLPAVR